MKKILANADRCSGCRLCETVCSFIHEDRFGSSVSRINVMKEDSFGFDLPIQCWHCENCTAMKSCSSNAIQRNPEGLIYVDEKRCKGCGQCVKTCYIGALRLHPEKRSPLICDLCDGNPRCVEKCPTKTLKYSDTELSRPKLPQKVLEDTLKKWRIAKREIV